jgi:hypothetical protein
MPEPRARLVVGARTVVGLVGVVVGIGVVAASTFLPLPTASISPSSITVVPVASAEQLVCPGAVLRLGDESGANATAATAIGSASVTRAATTGEVESRPLAATDAGGGLGAPLALSLPAQSEAGLAGSQSQFVELDDYRGLSAAECSAPSSDVWLVGGSTAVGRTTLLTIANPGTVSSTVEVELYGDDGIVEAPGTSGIVVAAGSQRVISLAGFAPSLASIAVHVTSRGGPVTANLQQSIVRGIDPGGIDIVGATEAPATTHVIPGVTLRNTVEMQSLVGLEGFEDLETVLRVFVPGDEPAATTVTITPANPGAESSTFSLTLDAGVVTDVPVDELEDGIYSIAVEADVPVVASVRASTASADLVDLAWYPAATALTGDGLVAVAPGPNATLTLSNTTDAVVTATLDGVSIEVPARSAVSTPVDDNRTVLLANGAGLFASVGYSGKGALASFVVSASATEEAPVVVYP